MSETEADRMIRKLQEFRRRIAAQGRLDALEGADAATALHAEGSIDSAAWAAAFLGAAVDAHGGLAVDAGEVRRWFGLAIEAGRRAGRTIGDRPEAPTAFRPLSDQVLVRLDAPAEAVGSLALPEQSRTRQRIGEVLAVGPGRLDGDRLVPMELRPGDRVVLGKYVGDDVQVDDGDAVVVRESEVLGTLVTE